MAKPIIKQNSRLKIFRSKSYNYTFDLRSGHFFHWATKPDERPAWSPFGPEQIDVEVSSGAGCPTTCAGCYKNNKKGNEAKNMSFETFKSIFDKLPYVLTNDEKRIYFITQINFGITSVASNPELFDMFDHCRTNGVIPNVTINGKDPLTDLEVQRIADTCGSVAISVGIAFTSDGLNLVKRMMNASAPRVDIHYVLSNQSIDFLYDFLGILKKDDELKNLNSIVFLGLKPKNRGENYDILPSGEHIRLVKYCLAKQIRFHWDTCSAPRFEKAIMFLEMSKAQKGELMGRSERCTAGLFSGYIDVNGKYWQCAFGEDIKKAGGIDILEIDDFHKSVWLSESLREWRKNVHELNRECALFDSIHSNK